MSLLVSGLTATAVALMAVILLWSEQKALAAAFRGEQISRAEALAEVCRDAVINQQYVPLSNYLRHMKESPEVVEAFCASKEGEVLGHTDVSRVQTALAGPLESAPPLEETASAVTASAPVRVGENPIGAARVVYDRDALRRRFDESLARARRRILRVSLPVLLAGFGGAFLLTALGLRPLGGLVEGVRLVASGRWDHRLPAPKGDEIGWLAGEFNQMAEKLGELDHMKQDFVSGVTHDLKTPIAGTRLALDVIQRETEGLLAGRPAPASLGEAFLHARERLERLTHLISSLLDVARIESLTQLEKKPVDLEELADRVVKSFELISRQKGLELGVTVVNAVPPVSGDEGKLERALSNLVGNAVKFTAKGKVEVRLEKKDGAVEVAVSDTGPGIPPADMDRLFSKFFRVKRSGEKVEGTGLGLAIAKGFVEAHGGTVSAASRPGEGTTFTLRIPA